MSELVERHPGVHHILLAKELAWLRIELTTDHLLVDVMVASYDHLVDGSLRALDNAQIERYGVALDVSLHGVYA